ncbi:MAG: tetratricopeptide repeat protein, partial [Deltaproteobacteria bacterium]|nr:tetratricopeptide repeat protein [Deltaproteobacteria bacterium]
MSAIKKNKRFVTVGLLTVFFLVLLTGAGCSPVNDLLIQGDTLAKEKKYSEALAVYAEADSHESDSVLGLCRAGNLQLQQKRPGPALQAFEQALEKLPDSPEAYLGVAKVYLFKGIDATAVQALERVMKLDPQNPEPYYIKGMILKR